MIRKNDPNSDFWQLAERVSRKVDDFPPWKLGRLEQMSFKVGDMVRVNRPVSECHKAEGEILQFGKIGGEFGTITRVNKITGQYCVRVSDDEFVMMHASNLELVSNPGGAGWDINVRLSKLSYDRILRKAEPHMFAIVRRNDESKCILLVTASGRSRIAAVRQVSYLTWLPLHDDIAEAIDEAERVKTLVEAFERNQKDPRVQVRVEVV